MDVLITGAAGTVGTAITDHLSDDTYDFTLLDVVETDGPGESVVADVRDYEVIRPSFDEQEAIVHLALIQEDGKFSHTSREVSWSPTLQANLEGINNVYEAAIDAGVESIVFASSNHAVGMVEVRNSPRVYHDEGIVAGHDEPHRPDSLYGLSKSYGEDLGRLAAEAHDVRFYALRIGSVRESQYDHPYGDAERGVEAGRWERGSDAYEQQVARMKGLWQSRRDLAHLVECCLQDKTVEWGHFYGVSANERRWLDDLVHARETIGYEPQDNGDEWDAPPETQSEK
ncbi:NAD-dependent epimerase/dehydratase family protein [Halobacteriaceae archaeon SHR40]|uniref:NAD-dependent epimerase/dehydratase family protein n=1 Tax=Halovenus amylolytica TaxID=2500550 RepID=UPI000FE2A415